jgi:hypothetical protein
VVLNCLYLITIIQASLLKKARAFLTQALWFIV